MLSEVPVGPQNARPATLPWESAVSEQAELNEAYYCRADSAFGAERPYQGLGFPYRRPAHPLSRNNMASRVATVA